MTTPYRLLQKNFQVSFWEHQFLVKKSLIEPGNLCGLCSQSQNNGILFRTIDFIVERREDAEQFEQCVDKNSKIELIRFDESR